MDESKVTTNAANATEAEEKGKEKVLVWEPRPFECFGKTTRVNSKDLAIIIKEQFQQSFADLVGCLISTIGNNIQVQLFFENVPGDVPEGKIKNLINLANPKEAGNMDFFNKVKMLNKKTTGKTYELSEDTKALLSEFMYGGKRNTNRKWNELITEVIEPAPVGMYQYGSQRIVMAVTGLDINVICKHLYGNRMITETVKEGNNIVNKTEAAFYNCRVTPNSILADSSFMINIEQFAKDKVQTMFKAENPQFVQNSGILYY